MHLHKSLKSTVFLVLLLAFTMNAQQTNPVDKQVSNPMTDTPNKILKHRNANSQQTMDNQPATTKFQ
jgi:hypothetical protein